MSFYTALTGLNGAQSDISATSNNIANVGTMGFRSSRVEFADVFSSSPFANQRTAIGSGVMFPAIEAALTGMKAGEEKTVDVDFPADWRVPQFAGKQVQVHVKAVEVAAPVLPEVETMNTGAAGSSSTGSAGGHAAAAAGSSTGTAPSSRAVATGRCRPASWKTMKPRRKHIGIWTVSGMSPGPLWSSLTRCSRPVGVLVRLWRDVWSAELQRWSLDASSQHQRASQRLRVASRMSVLSRQPLIRI